MKESTLVKISIKLRSAMIWSIGNYRDIAEDAAALIG